MRVVKEKRKGKTIIFQSSKKHKFVLVELPKGYMKKKLPLLNKWTHTLVAGGYRQGTGKLCIKNAQGRLNYCCLGVLSKIQGRLRHEKNQGYCDGRQDDPPSAMEAVGLTSNNPAHRVLKLYGVFPKHVIVRTAFKSIKEKNIEPSFYGYSIDASNLAECNDALGMTFKDIAKLLKLLYK
jgi:hypothetical protein